MDLMETLSEFLVRFICSGASLVLIIRGLNEFSAVKEAILNLVERGNSPIA